MDIWEKTCHAKRSSRCRGPRMSGLLEGHLGGRCPWNRVNKGIKPERKQEAKLCNPLFSTEVLGLCDTFVQIGKRCFLCYRCSCTPVLDLANEVRPGRQSLFDAFGKCPDGTVECDGLGLVIYAVLTQEQYLPLSFE